VKKLAGLKFERAIFGHGELDKGASRAIAKRPAPCETSAKIALGFLEIKGAAAAGFQRVAAFSCARAVLRPVRGFDRVDLNRPRLIAEIDASDCAYGVICSYENFGISARSLACSIVMAQICPLLSRSKRVFSSRSLVSATSHARNSMCNVSVS
jgi:hypothetical protein